MQIETGKYYKTSLGEKVYVTAIESGPPGESVLYGRALARIVSSTRDGKERLDTFVQTFNLVGGELGEQSVGNIVEEWKESTTRKAYLWRMVGTGTLVVDDSSYNENGNFELLGTARITEGEFCDD